MKLAEHIIIRRTFCDLSTLLIQPVHLRMQALVPMSAIHPLRTVRSLDPKQTRGLTLNFPETYRSARGDDNAIGAWTSNLRDRSVVVGVVFGLIQLRQLRHQRETQAGIELLHSLRQMGSASLTLYELPDNLSGDELRAQLGDKFQSVFDLLAVFESLGPLVARG